LGFFV